MTTEEIIKGLEIKIRDCNSNPNDVSWGMQEGIIISKSDAIAIVENLRIAEKVREFDLDFGGHLKARLEIKNNIPKVIGAMNGWGNGISVEDIIITEK